MSLTHTTVNTKLDVLIAKANALKTTLGPSGPSLDQYGNEVTAKSAHTFYGITDALAEDVDKSIEAIVLAEQKVLAIFS